MFQFEANEKTVVKQLQVLEKALSTDPKTERRLRKLIGDVIKEAREEVVRAVGSSMVSDPRGTKNSVRRTVYKKILGANLNIFNSQKAGAPSDYEPPRKLDSNPRQRGGNRVPRSPNTRRLMFYNSKDRGFILRFLNSGTGIREAGTKGGRLHGNRGAIAARNFFRQNAQVEMEKAVERLSQIVEFELAKIMNENN